MNRWLTVNPSKAYKWMMVDNEARDDVRQLREKVRLLEVKLNGHTQALALLMEHLCLELITEPEKIIPEKTVLRKKKSPN